MWQDCILSAKLFNIYNEYSHKEKVQLGRKIQPNEEEMAEFITRVKTVEDLVFLINVAKIKITSNSADCMMTSKYYNLK